MRDYQRSIHSHVRDQGDGRLRVASSLLDLEHSFHLEMMVSTKDWVIESASATMGMTPLSEAAMQLMGRCGNRQLGPTTNTRSPEVIMCSDNGAVLQTHSCIILRRS